MDGTLISAAVWIVVAFFALFLILMAFVFHNRAQRNRERQQLADAEFERQIFSTIGTTTEDVPLKNTKQNAGSILDLPGLQDTMEDESTSASASAVVGPAAAVSSTRPLGEHYESVLAQLRAANMVDEVEGHVEINGNPKAAAIIRLRDKRRALLVGHFETDAFTLRNLKRFELLIFVGRDGRGVVIDTVENFITDRLSSSFRL